MSRNIGGTELLDRLLHVYTRKRVDSGRRIAESGKRIAILAVLSFVYLLFASQFSSPLTRCIGIDYDMFVLGGEALLDGRLYTGFFDNKGPYLFAINALGLLISSGKWGIFLLEVLYFTWVLELLWRIGVTLGASARRIACGIAFALTLLLFTIAFGDSVEFWSLAFVLWPLLRYLRGGENALLCGVCFGIVTLLRVNDSAFIVAVCVAEICRMARCREYRKLWRYAGLFTAGMIVALLPAVIYFGVMGSLGDMLYATFGYNLQYSVYHRASWRKSVWLMVVCGLLPFVARRYDREHATRYTLVVTIACVLQFLLLIKIWVLMHYYTMLLPMNFLLVAMSQGIKKRWLALMMAAVMTKYIMRDFSQVAIRVQRVWYLLTDEERRDSLMNNDRRVMERAVAAIPPNERDSIYQLEIFRKYWGISYYMGYKPVGKYVNQQSHHGYIEGAPKPYLGADVKRHFEAANPRWIVSGTKLRSSALRDYSIRYVMVDSCRFTPEVAFYIYRRK